MSTLTVARKGGQVAIASDSLTTFDELKLPPDNDAAPEKIFAVETEHGPAYVGVVGYAAHFLVLQSALDALGELDFSSRRGVFDTFHDLHPLLKDEFFLNPEAGEGDPYESSQVTVLIAAPHGIYGVYDLREVHAYERFWAMGSGGDWALGAMWAAYDAADSAESVARRGVEAGTTFDRSSGGDVQVWTLEGAGPHA